MSLYSLLFMVDLEILRKQADLSNIYLPPETFFFFIRKCCLFQPFHSTIYQSILSKLAQVIQFSTLRNYDTRFKDKGRTRYRTRTRNEISEKLHIY